MGYHQNHRFQYILNGLMLDPHFRETSIWIMCMAFQLFIPTVRRVAHWQRSNPLWPPAGHEPWAKPLGVGLEHKEFYQNSIISCAKQKECGICWILMDLQLDDISCFNHSSTDILDKQKWFPRSSRWPASQSLPTLGSSPQSYRRSVCQMFLGAASSLKSKKRRLSIFTHDLGIPRHIHLFGVNCSQK